MGLPGYARAVATLTLISSSQKHRRIFFMHCTQIADFTFQAQSSEGVS
jgi:hypothetical protein